MLCGTRGDTSARSPVSAAGATFGRLLLPPSLDTQVAPTTRPLSPPLKGELSPEPATVTEGSPSRLPQPYENTPRTCASGSRCRQSQEKKRSHRVFRLGRRKIKFNPCFPGACTSENTLCSLQVCERPPQASARSRLKPLLSAKPLGFVDSLKSCRLAGFFA